MRTSETVKTIFPAFIRAQAKIKAAAKTGLNPHFGHSYSTLADVFDTTKDMLQEFGLGFLQSPENGEISGVRSVKVVTRIIHECGEWIESDVSVELSKAGPQEMGSAITYLRRYAFSSLFGVASEEDDDGNKAEGGQKQTESKTYTKTAPPKQQPTQSMTPTPVVTNPPPEPTPTQTGELSEEEKCLIGLGEADTVNGLVKVMARIKTKTPKILDLYASRLKDLRTSGK